VINRPELGQIAVGAEADVAVLRLLNGSFGFIDTGGGKMTGSQKLQCELTLRAGQVVWDLNGLSVPAWSDVPYRDPNAPTPRRTTTRQ
jgi:dihydroorotase